MAVKHEAAKKAQPKKQNASVLKWATRILFLSIFVSACSWLDTIKVRVMDSDTEFLFTIVSGPVVCSGPNRAS